jgi:hypothetical protein
MVRPFHYFPLKSEKFCVAIFADAVENMLELGAKDSDFEILCFNVSRRKHEGIPGLAEYATGESAFRLYISLFSIEMI